MNHPSSEIFLHPIILVKKKKNEVVLFSGISKYHNFSDGITVQIEWIIPFLSHIFMVEKYLKNFYKNIFLFVEKILYLRNEIRNCMGQIVE